GVVPIARAREELGERLNEARGEMLPDENRARHVHVRSRIAVEQMVDPVGVVQVARNDLDLERDARLRLELEGVPLHTRDVGVGVGPEEPHAHSITARSRPGRIARRGVPTAPGGIRRGDGPGFIQTRAYALISPQTGANVEASTVGCASVLSPDSTP